MRALSCVCLLIIALVAAASPSGAAGTTIRGPWLLTALPGMGTVTWRCDPTRNAQGRPALALAVTTASASATETIAFRAGGRALVRKVLQPGQRLDLPYLRFLRQRLSIVQATEPGTLRAVVDVDFGPRPVSPSHCFAQLPPALAVRLYPR